MSPTMLLDIGLAAIGLSIAVLASVILSARARQQAVAQALSDIETVYSAHVPQNPPAADRFAAFSDQLRQLGLKMSPPALRSTLQHRLDIAGNPPRWTADRILVLKGLGLLALAMLGAI
jgi:tight adherence protein C